MSCATNMATLQIKLPVQADMNIGNTFIFRQSILLIFQHKKCKILAWTTTVTLILNPSLLEKCKAILNSYTLMERFLLWN